MPNAVTRFYWDSNVFLHYINETPAFLAVIDQLLLNARNEEIEIVTSVMTIAEVAYAASEKAGKQLDQTIEDRIEKLWVPPSPVQLVEFHTLVAEDARRLMRAALDQGWSLKPYDAVHMATASRMHVDRVHTYEPGWRKYAALISCPVEEPSTAQVGLFPPNT